MIAHGATDACLVNMRPFYRFNPRPVIAHGATSSAPRCAVTARMFQSAPRDRSRGDSHTRSAWRDAVFFNPRPVIAHGATLRPWLVPESQGVSSWFPPAWQRLPLRQSPICQRTVEKTRFYWPFGAPRNSRLPPGTRGSRSRRHNTKGSVKSTGSLTP